MKVTDFYVDFENAYFEIETELLSFQVRRSENIK